MAKNMQRCIGTIVGPAFLGMILACGGGGETTHVSNTSADGVVTRGFSTESGSFQRAAEIVRLFLSGDAEATLSKSDEYENSSGFRTVKGEYRSAAGSYKWTISFGPQGIGGFNFDSVTFLVRQASGRLSYLPENIEYVTNDVIKMPTVEQLRQAGVEVIVGFDIDNPVMAEESAKRKTEMTRIWTAADGMSSVKAEFVSYGQGKVKLRKEDGTTVDVEVEKLCDEDKEFLRKHFRERGLKPKFSLRVLLRRS